MAQCETCGNDYDKPLTVTVCGGPARTFDSIECLAHALAPKCAHCARHAGASAIRDRA